MASEQLYDDGMQDWLLEGESNRVKEIYRVEKERWLTDRGHTLEEHPMGHGGGGTCGVCKRFRGDLAAEWVALAEKVQGLSDVHLVIPGTIGKRKDEVEYESEDERRVDAGRTRIRELERGKFQSPWVTVGIETTICERRDRAYPAGAYNSQRSLDL